MNSEERKAKAIRAFVNRARVKGATIGSAIEAALEAAGLNELVEALEAITKACVADCGDGRAANPEDPDDLGCVGWDGDGNPLSLTFEMIRAGQAALTGDKSNG